MSREFKITLTEEDVFQLTLMRDRAQRDSRVFQMALDCADEDGYASHPSACRFTETSREGQNDLDCLNRVLGQIRNPQSAIRT